MVSKTKIPIEELVANACEALEGINYLKRKFPEVDIGLGQEITNGIDYKGTPFKVYLVYPDAGIGKQTDNLFTVEIAGGGEPLSVNMEHLLNGAKTFLGDNRVVDVLVGEGNNSSREPVSVGQYLDLGVNGDKVTKYVDVDLTLRTPGTNGTKDELNYYTSDLGKPDETSMLIVPSILLPKDFTQSLEGRYKIDIEEIPSGSDKLLKFRGRELTFNEFIGWLIKPILENPSVTRSVISDASFRMPIGELGLSDTPPKFAINSGGEDSRYLDCLVRNPAGGGYFDTLKIQFPYKDLPQVREFFRTISPGS